MGSTPSRANPALELETPRGSGIQRIAFKESRYSREQNDPDVHTEWKNYTVISTECLSVDGPDKAVHISVDRGSVVRFGLTTADPTKDENFLQMKIFETEEGTGNSPETYHLYTNRDFYLLYFQNGDDNAREYECASDSVDTWLYIIAVYGSPNVSVCQGNENIHMERLQNTEQAHTLDTCYARHPIMMGATYHILWKMGLEHEKFAGKIPEYGVMRLSLMHSSGATIWDRTSGVFDRCFNGVVAVKFDVAGFVKHNLLVQSVCSELTEVVRYPKGGTLHLHVAFSSGQIEIFPMAGGAYVKQSHGSLIYMELGQVPPDEVLLRNSISAETKADIIDIVFGPHPLKCVVEFRSFISPIYSEALKVSLCTRADRIHETNQVQVFAPSALTSDDLEDFFTREQVGGGRCRIKPPLTNEDDETVIWIVTFNDFQVARGIWLRRTHLINRTLVHVLPYYKELGIATKSPDGCYGRLPFIKEECVTVCIDDVDKFKFVSSNDQRTHLEEYLNKEHKVTLTWPEEMSFPCDDHQGNRVEIRKSDPYSRLRERDEWKTSIEKAAITYFSNEIRKEIITFQPAQWELAMARVQQAEYSKSELYISRLTADHQLVIVGRRKSNALQTLLDSLPECDIPSNNFQELKLTIEKYNCLREEKKLDAVEKKFPGIFFRINNATNNVDICSSGKLIEDAKTTIFRLATNIKNLSLPLENMHTRLFMSEKGRELLKEILTKCKIYSNFEITHRNSLMITTFCENQRLTDAKRAKLMEAIANELSSDSIEVDKISWQALTSDSWSNFMFNLEAEFPVHISTAVHGQKIEMFGLNSCLTKVKEMILKFLGTEAEGKEIVNIPSSFAEYIDLEKAEPFEINCVFVKDTMGEYTGSVIITGQVDKVKHTREKLFREMEEIAIHWCYISKRWVAGTIECLPIQNIQRLNSCCIQAEIVDTFAANNICCVSVHKTNGAILQAKVIDITHQRVDLIACPNDPSMTFTDRISGQIAQAGGPTIKQNCQDYVHAKGPVEEGNAVEGDSGKLHCTSIVYVVPPKWKSGNNNEKGLMIKAVKSVLQIASKKCLVSVGLPPLWCGRYPVLDGVAHVVEAVTEFIEQNPKTSVKEVLFCTQNDNTAETFMKCMGTLQGTWFTLQGRRPVQQELIESTSTPTDDQHALNNNSVIKLGDSLFWTRRRDRRHLQTIRWTNNEEPHEDLPVQNNGYSNGLPYKIAVTERTTLHIVSGDVTQQQADVIVNVCDSYPHTTGRLSMDIIRAGDIMQEWNNLGSLEIGEVKSTDTGKGRLKSKCVFHVIGPSTECNFIANLNIIADLVRGCLEKTTQDGYTSIVFPVLNQGRLRDDKVAEAMVKAIVQFLNKPNENISEIFIVIYYTDKFTENVFEQTIPTLLQIAMPTEDDASNIPVVGRRTAVYVEPNTLEHTDADDVAVFKIVAKKGNIQQIMSKIKDYIEAEIPSEEFIADQDQPLSVKEETCLKTLEKKHIVDVSIDKNTKRIVVTGLRKNVERCKLEVMQLLFKDFPLWRYRETLMELVANSVQWYYEEDGVKKEHDRSSNLELQYGFTAGKDFTYMCNGVRFNVDLQRQRECPEENPGQFRQLYQRFIANQNIEIPEHWSISWTQGTDQARVQLSPAVQEFIDVKAKFLKDGLQPNTIINIFRLEHRYMWMTYQAKKQHIESQNPRGVQNERSLWHGTDSGTIDLIVRSGYDRSFCGRNATAYGNGAYFATSSQYSNGYAHTDASGVRRMFLNKVLTGEYTTGVNGMSCLPQKSIVNGIPVLFDSAVNQVVNPTIFVIFHDSQVYPEYLIEYK